MLGMKKVFCLSLFILFLYRACVETLPCTNTSDKTNQMEGSSFSLKNLFTRGDTQQMVLHDASEQKAKRGYYEREVDRDLEVILQLDEHIKQCDRHIERYTKELDELTGAVNALKAQHNKLANKQSTQAQDLARKATAIIAQRKILEARINSYQQQRLTLSTQVENHRNVKEAEAMSILMKESTIRMQGSMANLDMGTVGKTASDARLTSDKVGNISAIIFNPFEISPEEQHSSFLDEFNALELGDEQVVEEPMIVLPPLPQRQTSVVKNNTNNLLIEDDLF